MFRTVVFSICVLAPSLALGQEQAKPRRAKLPRWKDSQTAIFFKDAFREGLVGERPITLGRAASSAPAAESQKGPSSVTDDSDSASWSRVVSSRTLEDEIKKLQIAVQQSVTTPGRFSGGGYRDVRRQFTELATLFAVIGSYDGTVRWKKEAPLARDLFARAASNAKVTSIQAFNEAKLRKLDLEELVRGGTLNATRPIEAKNDWEQICDRGPLMQRIGMGFDDGLTVWTANSSEFKSNLEKIQREAELMQLFAVIMTQEGMEDAGDEDYDAYCRQLGDAAAALVQATRDQDAGAARKAASDIGKSCNACHEDYRG